MCISGFKITLVEQVLYTQGTTQARSAGQYLELFVLISTISDTCVGLSA